jgi:hypothetical protein
MEDNLVRAFSGNEIEVISLQGELEGNGISSSTNYGSTSGVNPFWGGSPVELDLYILQKDLEKAEKIIREFVQSRGGEK